MIWGRCSGQESWIPRRRCCNSALSIRKKLLGPEHDVIHQQVAQPVNLLEDQGKVRSAGMLREALAISQKATRG